MHAEFGYTFYCFKQAIKEQARHGGVKRHLKVEASVATFKEVLGGSAVQDTLQKWKFRRERSEGAQ